MAERTGETVKIDRIETQSTSNFPDAVRAVQVGRQVRRAGWESSLLYLRLSAAGAVELVCEGGGDEGRYCYGVPYLGGGAIGGPPMEDLLADDWTAVDDPRVPTRDGTEAATAELLDEAGTELEREAVRVP